MTGAAARRSTLASVVALCVVVIAACVTIVGPTSSAGAAPLAPEAFNPNNVMDDAVFDDTSTMTVADIQALLNRYPNSCLRSYSDVEPLSRTTYGATVSAATIIYDAAQLWGVNPQVLLATLEKEQSLVRGPAGGCAPWRYWSAMGYGCPDGGAQYAYPNLGITSTCVNFEAAAGFSRQVNRGAWQLQFNKQRAEGNLDWGGFGSTPNYGYNTTGWRRQYSGAALVYYDGYASIDGTSVFMSNGATATLYTYTPHPAGAQSFYNLFTMWFGSVRQVRVDQTPYVAGVYRVLLRRAPDAGGLRFWADYLNAGGSPAYFVRSIVTGAEYTTITVADDYLQILRRVGDSAGVGHWAGQLSSSGRNDLIQAFLAGSDEYFVGRSSSDIATFVSNLYIDLLDRSIDPAGLAYWKDQIANKGLSHSAYALSIADSDESALWLVEKAYLLVLGRDADAAGQRYWADRYVRTHDLLELVVSLASSAEGQVHLAAPVVNTAAALTTPTTTAPTTTAAPA